MGRLHVAIALTRDEDGTIVAHDGVGYTVQPVASEAISDLL
jgi:hypothetical protein